MKNITWSVSDISKPLPLHSDVLEFRDIKEQWNVFYLIATTDRIVFGGYCNAGFMESGFIVREDYESLDETLSELFSDLEVYYNEGPQYTSRIVCNERM